MVILNFLKNVPTEMIERDMPSILIRRYGLREDSGGAGKYRGGTGTVIEFETASPYTTVTSRCMERYLFPPAGRMGGSPGTTGYTTLNPGTNHERDIGKIDVLEMEPGDVLRIGTQGGGGFGDPLQRPAEKVAEDLANAFISPATARDAYGVVVDSEGRLDQPATKARRAGLAAARSWHEPPAFSFGPAREDYHARWPRELHDAVAGAAEGLPTLLRQLYHQQLTAEIDRRMASGQRVAPADVAAIFAELRRAPVATRPAAE